MPIRDGRGRRVTKLFFQPREAALRQDFAASQALRSALEYAGRDVFADLAEPARQRGIKLYERMYEPGDEGLLQNITGAERDSDGRRVRPAGQKPCWNHPDYLSCAEAWVRDLFSSYPLDGIQYGAERNGPLSRLIDWGGDDPTCFCDSVGSARRGRAWTSSGPSRD